MTLLVQGGATMRQGPATVPGAGIGGDPQAAQRGVSGTKTTDAGDFGAILAAATAGAGVPPSVPGGLAAALVAPQPAIAGANARVKLGSVAGRLRDGTGTGLLSEAAADATPPIAMSLVMAVPIPLAPPAPMQAAAPPSSGQVGAMEAQLSGLEQALSAVAAGPGGTAAAIALASPPFPLGQAEADGGPAAPVTVSAVAGYIPGPPIAAATAMAPALFVPATASQGVAVASPGNNPTVATPGAAIAPGAGAVSAARPVAAAAAQPGGSPKAAADSPVAVSPVAPAEIASSEAPTSVLDQTAVPAQPTAAIALAAAMPAVVAPGQGRAPRDTGAGDGGKGLMVESRADGLPILTDAVVQPVVGPVQATNTAKRPAGHDAVLPATAAPLPQVAIATAPPVLPAAATTPSQSDMPAGPGPTHAALPATDLAAAFAGVSVVPAPATTTAQEAAPALAAAPLPPRLATEAGQQVALRVANAVAGGMDRVSVDLRPPALGRVEVSLTFREGTVQVVVASERVATYEAFRQDRAQLEHQLAQAGIDLGGGALDLRHGSLPREREPEAPKPAPIETAGIATDGAPDQPPDPLAGRRQSNSLIDFVA